MESKICCKWTRYERWVGSSNDRCRSSSKSRIIQQNLENIQNMLPALPHHNNDTKAPEIDGIDRRDGRDENNK
eukprot:15138292-Ditylum_brightwellii.AAC.1